jgi:membrane-associated phospholipid phosphatase
MRATPQANVVSAMMVCVVSGARGAAAQEAYRELFPPPPLVLADQTPAQPADGDAVPTLLEATRSQTQPAPEPEHTGFSALVHATGADFAAFPRRKSTWVILAAGAAGAAIAHPLDDNIEGHTFSKGQKNFFVLGKYLGSAYVEAGVAVGLYAIGRYAMPHAKGEPRTNKVSHIGFDLIRANIVSQVFVQAIKIAARRDRPDGTCCAFPSGHATTAFATASVLERHFGYRGAWPTMVAAAYVAGSRLADHQHFLSDVVFGSALGIATGWTVVGRHGRENFTMVPVPTRGGIALMFTRVQPEAGGSH